MRIVIAGGSGQIGTLLAREYTARGHSVVILSRTAAHAGPWRYASWDAKTLGAWAADVDGCEVVINMAGRSVNCRYTAQNQGEMMASRVDSTRALGAAIAAAANPPKVWLQSSTATIYAHRFDAPNDEATGIIGGNEPDAPAKWRFSIDVARAWEGACTESDAPRTRKVLLRSAMVMSPDRGGIFDTLLTLVRRGLGGPAGTGKQYISWIHERDFINALDFLIARENIEGPVNVASPHPLPNAQFMRELREAAGVRIALPASALMIRAGAFVMGTEAELVLKSRRVVPQRLLESGFQFQFAHWHDAAADLTARMRA